MLIKIGVHILPAYSIRAFKTKRLSDTSTWSCTDPDSHLNTFVHACLLLNLWKIQKSEPQTWNLQYNLHLWHKLHNFANQASSSYLIQYVAAFVKHLSFPMTIFGFGWYSTTQQKWHFFHRRFVQVSWQFKKAPYTHTSVARIKDCPDSDFACHDNFYITPQKQRNKSHLHIVGW